MTAPRIGLAKATDVARFLGTAPKLLAQWRYEGRGPQYVKVGRLVRYRWDDVQAWVDANLHQGGGAR